MADKIDDAVSVAREALGSSSLCEDTHRAADGLVVVPREPTEAMVKAFWSAFDGASDGQEIRTAIRAMIAATQQPAGEGEGQFEAEALRIVKRHGSPVGNDYEQGQNDMGFRMVTLARAADAALSAAQQPVSEGVGALFNAHISGGGNVDINPAHVVSFDRRDCWDDEERVNLANGSSYRLGKGTAARLREAMAPDGIAGTLDARPCCSIQS